MRILYITLMYNVQVYEMIKICTYFIKQNKKCLISEPKVYVALLAVEVPFNAD